MITKISQSFIKSFKDYLSGQECGNIIREQFINDKLIERDSKAMDEGSYFEYCLSGALPKNGQIPKGILTKSGGKSMENKRAEVNAARVKSMLNDMGLEFVKIGRKITKGRFEGTIDLICRVTKVVEGFTWKVGDEIVIDLKYSGLLYDKWEKHGWMWSNIQKEYHGIQAKHYHIITVLPFYFLVVGNKNLEVDGVFAPTDMKLFYVPVDEHMIEVHTAEANDLFEKFKFEAEIGFTPRPSYRVCSKCPLRETCDDKHIYPLPETVDLTIGI